MKKRFRRRSVFHLKVALVDEILESLKSARINSNLGGPRRHELAIAFEQLAKARAEACGKDVTVPSETVLLVLKCFSVSQAWFSQMLNEFAEGDAQK